MVQDISDRVCEALENTANAVAENDRDALHLVVMKDYSINRDIRALDKMCHAFVARHLPAAGHLRFISAVLRITIALERAGDYAVTISRVVLQLKKPLPEKLIGRMQPMAALSVKMMHHATHAFLMGDTTDATETKRLDYDVDKAYDELFSALMEEGANRTPRELVSLLKIFSKVERFSDQAKNICEEAVFAATGEMKEPKRFKVLFVDEKNDLVSQLAEVIARKGHPEGGSYASAGWAPSKSVDPRLGEIASRFGFDVTRAKPAQLGVLDTFPTPYHLIVAINLSDESLLPNLPYHTVLRQWQVDDTDNLDNLVRHLSSRIDKLMEILRGKDSE